LQNLEALLKIAENGKQEAQAELERQSRQSAQLRNTNELLAAEKNDLN
jgi:hypothetical protein